MGHVQNLFQEVNHNVLLQFMAILFRRLLLGLGKLLAGLLPPPLRLVLLLK